MPGREHILWKHCGGITPGTAAANKAVVLDSNKKIDTLDAAELKQNGTAMSSAALAGLAANMGISALDGSTGNKACRVNGLSVITGGTGIADMTLAAPTEWAEAVIRIGTLSSGNVVVTTAAGVTFNGTNNTATFDAANECLILRYKAANTWEVVANIGAVSLTTVG